VRGHAVDFPAPCVEAEARQGNLGPVELEARLFGHEFIAPMFTICPPADIRT